MFKDILGDENTVKKGALHSSDREGGRPRKTQFHTQSPMYQIKFDDRKINEQIIYPHPSTTLADNKSGNNYDAQSLPKNKEKIKRDLFTLKRPRLLVLGTGSKKSGGFFKESKLDLQSAPKSYMCIGSIANQVMKGTGECTSGYISRFLPLVQSLSSPAHVALLRAILDTHMSSVKIDLLKSLRFVLDSKHNRTINSGEIGLIHTTATSLDQSNEIISSKTSHPLINVVGILTKSSNSIEKKDLSQASDSFEQIFSEFDLHRDEETGSQFNFASKPEPSSNINSLQRTDEIYDLNTDPGLLVGFNGNQIHERSKDRSEWLTEWLRRAWALKCASLEAILPPSILSKIETTVNHPNDIIPEERRFEVLSRMEENRLSTVSRDLRQTYAKQVETRRIRSITIIDEPKTIKKSDVRKKSNGTSRGVVGVNLRADFVKGGVSNSLLDRSRREAVTRRRS